MGRKEDLENDISNSYDLIRQYENKIRLADDPQTQERFKAKKNEQWKLIKGYLAEYVSLCEHSGTAVPENIAEIAVTAGVPLPSMPSDQPPPESVPAPSFAAPQPGEAQPTTPVPPPPAKQAGCSGRMGSRIVGLRVWYRSLPAAAQATIVVALIGLLGALGKPFMAELAKVWVARPTPMAAVTPTSTAPATLIPMHTPSTTPTSTPTSTSTDTPTPTVSPILTPSPSPTPTLTPTPTPTCAVTATTDAETLFAIIDAEAQAVLSEDIELIKAIFAPDAIIRNEATGQEWDSPEAYYTEKFRNEVHCRVEHYDYHILKLTKTEALVTTRGRGEWGWEAQGCTMTYENPPDADQWRFRKDAFGCWWIVRFTYNVQTQ